MSNALKYNFSGPGCGSLELELDESSRQVYHASLPATVLSTVEGLEADPGQDINGIHFFEWQNLHYSYINGNDSLFRPPFRLKINERVHKESHFRNNIHLLSGNFSFKDEVGETCIEIRDADNRLIFRLTAEVFPQKMDYSSDYKTMMADISSIIQNLALDSLKDTYRKSRAKLSGHTIQHEWWGILDVLFEQLVIHLGVIKRQPVHEIRSQEKVLPVEKIRQASKRNTDWLRKNARYSNKTGKGLKVGDRYFTHSLSGKKYVTYNTYENRFVAWAVKNIIVQLGNYYEHISKNSGNKDFSDLLSRMKKYQGKLQGILHQDPFNEAGEFEKRSHFSASLTRGAGYRDFMHVYLMLARGLEITNNDIFKIGQKNISTLYEYWCFLMLVKLLKEQNGNAVDFQDLIKVRSGKYRVVLKKGEASKVRFKKSVTGESTTIYFNKEFRSDGLKIFTFNQRPDYSIKFNKNGFEKPFWYLFDAKYRFEENRSRASESKNNFNVPQDAIGQLHRYRDAILHTQPASSTYRSAMKNLGGVILYPYPLPEEAFKSNDYYKSISEVNIGAMPFLPGKTKLVNEFLNRLINKSPEEHFEQFIEMDRSEYDENRDLWNEWVTISVIPKDCQEERIKFMQDRNIFHIPYVANLHSKLYMTKKLLACRSGSREAWLYDVENWELMNNKELRQLGTGWDHKKDKYVVFHLANGREIRTPEKISPSRYRYATLEGLNAYLKDPSKDRNSFYLTNPDAARLHKELVKNELIFELGWGRDENDPSLVGFRIGGIMLSSSENFQSLHYKFDGKDLHLAEVLKLLLKS
ncbi:MAG: hypothetical protein JWO44_1230 [Bacteroidetes bacterium]|nr:hypothetical protein [Bacteroidota bacterium]